VNSTIRPTSSSVTTPPGGALRVDEATQVEICEVVGIAREEELFARDPVPVGGQRSRAAEQFRLEDEADSRLLLGPNGDMRPHRIR
jgi:hypothetical protein